MRMKMKRLLVALMAFTMLATGMIGNTNNIQAAVDADLIGLEDYEYVIKPGETVHIKLQVQATGISISDPSIEVKATGEDTPFTFTRPTMSMYGTSTISIPSGAPTDIEFDVSADEMAKIGNYPVNVNFTYEKYSFDGGSLVSTKTVVPVPIMLKVLEEKIPAQLTIGKVMLGNSNVGNDTDITFTVYNEGELTAKNIYLKMDFGDDIEERYTAKEIKIGDLASGDSKKLTLPIKILSTATIGRKSLTANFTYKTMAGKPLDSKYNVSINLTSITSEIKTPRLSVEDIHYADGLVPGDDFKLSVDLKNIGVATAREVTISVDPTSIDTNGILTNYFTDGITVNTLVEDTEKTAEIPLSVSKYATGGLKGLKLLITYTDETGAEYSLTNTVYIDIVADTEVSGSPNLIINNVTQYPAQPVAGGEVEISFYLENKSSVDATDLKISTEGLTGNTFIPIESEPYKYIEKLKGGEKIKVTLALRVSENIPEGLNNLSVKCTYTGGDDVVATIPVRDVQNELEISSKPKLIVSKYYTDAEELRAGSTFNFTFDIYNTNATVSAKNITITVSQPENIFSVTQGSNSFFINKIDPGETVSNILELKVKSDASTKAYPIEILIEYEYDGAEPNPTTGEVGETKTEKLNLQAVENSRPVVDYVNVYSWEGAVMVGNTATLSFEFYNMGRSPLNNVIATVEGDFAKADGNMYFIGNVTEGGSTYVEFDVIPNIEGLANGVLKITFEDSNGDEVEFSKDFSTEVMSQGVIDPGIIDGGSGEVFNPDVQTAKKEILPIWAFIMIWVASFVIFVPVTRKIIINAYKAKLRRKEQEQY